MVSYCHCRVFWSLKLRYARSPLRVQVTRSRSAPSSTRAAVRAVRGCARCGSSRRATRARTAAVSAMRWLATAPAIAARVALPEPRCPAVCAPPPRSSLDNQVCDFRFNQCVQGLLLVIRVSAADWSALGARNWSARRHSRSISIGNAQLLRRNVLHSWCWCLRRSTVAAE